MNKLKEDLKKFFTPRNVLIAAVFLIVSLVWFKYVSGLVLVGIFVPFTFLSVRYSKMIPHVSIESNTSMSCLMGYAFGPHIGLIYGLGAGGIAYLGNSFVSATYLSTILLAGFAGLFTGILHFLGFSFAKAFLIAIILRTCIAFPLFGLLGTDPIERLTHQASQFFSNMIIYLPLLSAIYDLIAPFI